MAGFNGTLHRAVSSQQTPCAAQAGLMTQLSYSLGQDLFLNLPTFSVSRLGSSQVAWGTRLPASASVIDGSGFSINDVLGHKNPGRFLFLPPCFCRDAKTPQRALL